MNRNATHELTDAELDSVSGGDTKQPSPPPPPKNPYQWQETALSDTLTARY